MPCSGLARQQRPWAVAACRLGCCTGRSQLASYASVDDCELLLCLRHAGQVRAVLSHSSGRMLQQRESTPATL